MKTAELSYIRLVSAVFLCFTVLNGQTVAAAEDYSTTITTAEVRSVDNHYVMNSRIRYGLSPVAKEAITKGVSLSWVLHIRIRKKSWLWDKTLYALEIPWVIQYQALLNQYSVHNLHDQHRESFATLNSALDYMGGLHNFVLPGYDLPIGKQHYLAMRVEFDREFLPVPLRPESYFNSDWFLSGDWYIWPLQN
jgi:uncharacterized protein DUF4390